MNERIGKYHWYFKDGRKIENHLLSVELYNLDNKLPELCVETHCLTQFGHRAFQFDWEDAIDLAKTILDIENRRQDNTKPEDSR